MRVLHLHPGPDTGGKSMAAKAALEAHGDEVRVFVHHLHPFGYPEAEMWDASEVAKAYDWADIVVLHNQPADLYAKIPHGDKRLMVHHHGSHLRKLGESVWNEGRRLGAVQVVSTLDLLTFPDGHWLPQIVDLSLMAEIRQEHYRPGPRVRVVQAPTGRTKGSRLVKVSYRKEKGAYDYVGIHRVSWMECLARKATGDVLVDQVGTLALGYGANAIEAWGMGLPVISSGPARVLDRMREEWGGLPFYPVAEGNESVREAIRRFVLDADLRAEWGARGLAHARRFHDNAPFVQRFRQLAGAVTVTEVAA